ncbi:MAG: DUF1294 domain-containing protein [Clostridia bacterium]|nr:DUF1294 domain-containing protein [Clostridia bacterium]MBP5272172.1 DUF1294 domain-containing protein [Clostridia bacterium]MBP5460136.1 DUF1294 domain-containing protein [Clostridia bacterium]
MLQTVIYSYLVVINVVAFAIYGLDKKRAIHDEWRIPEATLLALAAVGGSVGALFGMQTFHHKTRKPKFKYGVPAMLLVHLALFYYFFIL